MISSHLVIPSYFEYFLSTARHLNLNFHKLTFKNHITVQFQQSYIIINDRWLKTGMTDNFNIAILDVWAIRFRARSVNHSQVYGSNAV